MIQTVKSKTGAAALIMAFISLLLTGIWSGTSAHAEAASPIKVAVDTKWVNFSVDPVVDGELCWCKCARCSSRWEFP